MPWSDWQDPWSAPFSGPDIAAVQYVARQITRDDGAPFDVATWIDSARASIMAGGGTSLSGFISSALSYFLDATGQYGRGILTLGYVAAKYQASDVTSESPTTDPPGLPDDAPYPPDAEYDDPTYGPYIRGRVGYEGPVRGDFVQWSDGGTWLQTYREFQDGDDEADLTQPMQTSPPPAVTYSWLTTLATDAWPAYPAGTVLETDDAPIVGTWGVILNHTLTPAITLEGITEPSLWIVAQPSFLDSSVPLPYGRVDLADHSWGARFYNGGIPRGGPGPFFNPGPNALFTTARWRYWIDDAIHTVGGHWATPGGAEVRMLQADGTTWRPIVDGAA